MPFTVEKNPNGGYDVLKHGKKVAHSDTLEGARGYMYHASKGESSSRLKSIKSKK